MSLTDKDIDQLFREAANSAPQVEFKEAYWDEMNDFLDQEQKNKRGIYSMLSIGILALIGIGSLLLIPNQNKYNNGTLAENIDTPTFRSSDNLFAIDANDKHTKISKRVDEKSSFTSSELDQVDEVKMAVTNKVVASRTITRKSAQASRKPLQQSNAPSLSIPSKSYLSTDKVDKHERRKIETVSVPLVSIDKTNDASVSNPETSANTATSSVLNSEQTENTQIERLSINSPSYLTNSFSNNANGIGDLINAKTLETLKDRLYVELGAGLADNYNDELSGRSMVFNGAINYEFRKNWLRVRTGIGANLTTNVNITYHNAAKVYDFGSRNSSNELVYKDLYDLYLPIEIGAYFNKVSFGVGYKYNFLNHSRAEFSTYDDGGLVENGVYYGLTEGLKENTSSAYFFIERNISGRVDLGIKMGTYLNSRASLSDQFELIGENIDPKYGFVYLKYNFRK